MRIPDLELLIEDSEKTSPNYVDDTERQKLVDEAAWMNWAEKQLAEAQREQQQRQYAPPDSKDHIDIIPGSSPMAGITWIIKTTESTTNNSRWVDNVPVTQSTPMVQS